MALGSSLDALGENLFLATPGILLAEFSSDPCACMTLAIISLLALSQGLFSVSSGYLCSLVCGTYHFQSEQWHMRYFFFSESL